MRLDSRTCRERFAAARVARLATAGVDGRPHIVPITFAFYSDVLITAVDQKPKLSTRLRRLRNIAENPQVSLLTDHYSDDWSELWWVRADGAARVLEDERTRRRAGALLAAKYEQYRDVPPAGPVIEINIRSWAGWAY